MFSIDMDAIEPYKLYIEVYLHEMLIPYLLRLHDNNIHYVTLSTIKTQFTYWCMNMIFYNNVKNQIDFNCHQLIYLMSSIGIKLFHIDGADDYNRDCFENIFIKT